MLPTVNHSHAKSSSGRGASVLPLLRRIVKPKQMDLE